ncbi:MAG: hypothetical protein Phog2KO_51000 [Phototrophicaceae bacterium]
MDLSIWYDYYEDFFRLPSRFDGGAPPVPWLFAPMIDPGSFTAPLLAEEIRDAIRSLPRSSSPKVDGIPPKFFNLEVDGIPPKFFKDFADERYIYILKERIDSTR